RCGVSRAEASRGPPGVRRRRRYKDECRQSLGLRLANECRADLRCSWREMLKSPAFSALAIAIPAVGIGARVAVFSGTHAVLLRMLPVQQPQQIRRVEWSARITGFFPSYNGSMRREAGGRVRVVGLLPRLPAFARRRV